VPSWPDIERAVVAWFAPLGRPVYTETGPTVPTEYLTVERVGGVGTSIDRDVDVEISVIAVTRTAMWDLVADVEARVRALAANGDPLGVPPFYVDDIAERFAFAFDPYPNTAARRATATYTLTVRPQ